MSKEIEVEPYYKKQAKELTDLLFDKGFLASDLSRESIDWLEDYIGFCFQIQTTAAIKAHGLLKKIKG